VAELYSATYSFGTPYGPACDESSRLRTLSSSRMRVSRTVVEERQRARLRRSWLRVRRLEVRQLLDVEVRVGHLLGADARHAAPLVELVLVDDARRVLRQLEVRVVALVLGRELRRKRLHRHVCWRRRGSWVCLVRRQGRGRVEPNARRGGWRVGSRGRALQHQRKRQNERQQRHGVLHWTQRQTTKRGMMMEARTMDGYAWCRTEEGRTRQRKSPSSIPRSQREIIGLPLLYRPSFLFSSSRIVLLFLPSPRFAHVSLSASRCDWENEQSSRAIGTGRWLTSGWNRESWFVSLVCLFGASRASRHGSQADVLGAVVGADTRQHLPSPRALLGSTWPSRAATLNHNEGDEDEDDDEDDDDDDSID